MSAISSPCYAIESGPRCLNESGPRATNTPRRPPSWPRSLSSIPPFYCSPTRPPYSRPQQTGSRALRSSSQQPCSSCSPPSDKTDGCRPSGCSWPSASETRPGRLCWRCSPSHAVTTGSAVGDQVRARHLDPRNRVDPRSRARFGARYRDSTAEAPRLRLDPRWVLVARNPVGGRPDLSLRPFLLRGLTPSRSGRATARRRSLCSM